MENTHFVASEGVGRKRLEGDVAMASSNAVIDGILKTVGGLLAVLNAQRQVIAVNDLFLKEFGVESSDKILGLRLGKVIGCIHADEEPDGCGTTKYCSSCGAAIAMVTSLAANEPVERICAVEIRQDEITTDLCLRVRAVPFACKEEHFLLLFIQDISRQQQRASEERLFFHDLKNVLSALQGAADLLTMGSPDMARHCGRLIRKLVYRLNCEVEMQRTLALSKEYTYAPRLEDVSVPGILLDIQEEFSNSPIARDKRFSVTSVNKPLYLRTDSCVLFRVLGNMIINAFEAAEPGDEIRLGTELTGAEMLRFTVWNRQVIPDKEQLHIFQRNFSTKPGEGRGLGTWSMKFFGEKVLGGQVDFTSKNPYGTLFFLTLPLRVTG